MSLRAAPSLRSGLLASLALLTGCGAATVTPAREDGPPLILSIVGTNDLHGHVEALPVLGGYLANLRRARAHDGAVLLLDGGDMFQGTLESNLVEGASIVRAYAALGYDAVAVGNHEFDYGPVGPHAHVVDPGDDPRGALLARMAEAPYPFLTSNVLLRATGVRAELGLASTMLVRGDVRVGVIGASTESTLTTTLAMNVSDLAMRPLLDAVGEEARRLRAEGAEVVVLVAHAGGHCHAFEDPDDLSVCEPHEELFDLAAALPTGLVDAMVGGHTHQGVAHRVNGTPIIESFSYGRAFGRLDLVLDRRDHHVIDVRIHHPEELCRGEACGTASYEAQPIVEDATVAAIAREASEQARAVRDEPLGVTVTDAITRSGGRESALGNLFTDLMRAAWPVADVALYNGGGLRADLAPGPLTFGGFYEALPFDNRFVLLETTARELAEVFAHNARSEGSFLSSSGVEVVVRCEPGGLVASLSRDGRPLAPDTTLRVLVSDFLATGGDDLIRSMRPSDVPTDEALRDGMLRVLRARGGSLESASLLDAAHPRVTLPGPRPVACPAAP